MPFLRVKRPERCSQNSRARELGGFLLKSLQHPKGSQPKNKNNKRKRLFSAFRETPQQKEATFTGSPKGRTFGPAKTGCFGSPKVPRGSAPATAELPGLRWAVAPGFSGPEPQASHGRRCCAGGWGGFFLGGGVVAAKGGGEGWGMGGAWLGQGRGGGAMAGEGGGGSPNKLHKALRSVLIWAPSP